VSQFYSTFVYYTWRNIHGNRLDLRNVRPFNWKQLLLPPPVATTCVFINNMQTAIPHLPINNLVLDCVTALVSSNPSTSSASASSAPATIVTVHQGSGPDLSNSTTTTVKFSQSKNNVPVHD
jgi:hypothetical protein